MALTNIGSVKKLFICAALGALQAPLMASANPLQISPAVGAVNDESPLGARLQRAGSLIPSLDRFDFGVSPSTTQELTLSKNTSITGGLGYSYRVGPAFVSNLHQRIDSYLIGTGFNVGLHLGIGVRAEVQVTYSRLFDSRRAAALALPIKPSQLPRTAQSALAGMRTGEAVRIEASSEGILGKGFENAGGFMHLDLYMGVSKGTRFLVDVFKASEQKVRVRFIAARSMGQLNAGASVNPLRIDFGLGLIERAVDQIISCKPVSLGFQQTLTQNTPVDVMALDYMIDLTQPAGAEAYNRIFETLLRVQPTMHLNTLKNANDFENALSRFAEVLETPYRAGRGQAVRAIDRVMKARTLNQLSQVNLGSGCLNLWNAGNQKVAMTSIVRMYDRDEKATDYMLLASEELNEHSTLFNRSRELDRTNLRVLFAAARTDENSPLSVNVDDLLEIRFRSILESKNFHGEKLETLTQSLQYLYPHFASTLTRELGSFVNEETQKNAYVRYEIGFDRAALALMQQNMTLGQVRSALIRFLNAHPSKDGLRSESGPLAAPADGSGAVYDEGLGRFEGDVARITVGVQAMLNTRLSNQDRVAAISSLRRVPLFRDIGAGFLMSLMPQDSRLLENVALSLSLGSSETANASKVMNPTSQQSLLRRLGLVLDAINSRSLDLRADELLVL